MGWSFPIGSVKGTVVRVHLTFLLLLGFIGFANYARLLQDDLFWSSFRIGLIWAFGGSICPSKLSTRMIASGPASSWS